MRGRTIGVGVAAVLCAAAAGGAAEPAGKLDGKAALARLKQLAGEWRGQAAAEKGGMPTSVVYAVTAGASTVTERLFPGTDHEMLTVYHLDGADLVLTHYCAMANQPRMRLVSATGPDPVEMTFDFAGGANVDPARDPHMHAGRLVLRGADRLEAEWAVHDKGKKVGANTFALERVKK
jgi:hypothetical protein